jgi:hypothetical protein
LLCHAIRADWPIPFERRGPIIREVVALFGDADGRRSNAAVSVYLAAGAANRRALRRAVTAGE